MDSNTAVAKAAPCKILLRISASLTKCGFAAKSAPQSVAKDTKVALLFFRPARGIPDLLIIRPRQPSSISDVRNSVQRCSADAGPSLSQTNLTHRARARLATASSTRARFRRA